MGFDPEIFPTFGHSFIIADAVRTRLFMKLYAQLADQAAAYGIDAPPTRAHHRSLLETIYSWEYAAWTKSVSEIVVLTDHDRRDLQARIRTLLLDLTDPENLGEDYNRVRKTLGAAVHHFGPVSSRTLFQLNVLLKKHEQLVNASHSMHIPRFLFTHGAKFAANLLSTWNLPPAPYSLDFGWRKGCEGLLYQGLRACAFQQSDGVHGRDIGLGVTSIIKKALDLDQETLWDLVELEWDSEDSFPALEKTTPRLAEYPWIARGRVHSHGPDLTCVRDHFEGTSPIGWAESDDLAALAATWCSLSNDACDLELTNVGRALRQARESGHAVIGCLELMTYESDGRRTWLVDKWNE